MVQRLKSRLRNLQRGQSILLLALGFIALAAFVGLVTDVSIMFVRYASLRQAVDSAAIAAAGQIREGTNYATVALSARQYITLHGLDPHRVWVETCETEIAEWRVNNPEPAPVTNMTEDDSELCDFESPRKLVKVVAQINSETTFLQLIGIPDFVLTASSISETAVLDVALVLDNSTSMANATTEIHYINEGMVVPNLTGPGAQANLDAHPQAADGTDLVLRNCIRHNGDVDGTPNWGWGQCCSDPGNNAFVYQDTGTGEWIIYTETTPIGPGSPPEYTPGPDPIGIVDNTRDGNFADLICQPFRQVKDAARNFIQRLDFIRGDRVSVVEFNRLAKIVYPGVGTELADPNADDAPLPMMTVEEIAIATLDEFVGLQVNPAGRNGFCHKEAEAFVTVWSDWNDDFEINDPNSNLRPYSYETFAQCTTTNMGDGIRRANEVLTNVRTIRREAVWVAIVLSDGAANAAYVREPVPTVYSEYGDFGFCPWSTFCYERPTTHPAYNALTMDITESGTTPVNEVPDGTQDTLIHVNSNIDGLSDTDVRDNYLEGFPYNSWAECNASIATASSLYDSNSGNNWLNTIQVLCNDGAPDTRHFCLEWVGSNLGQPAEVGAQPDCLEDGHYDADDYARDMADWAGLVEVAPNVPGNFIAMFAIGFGDLNRPENATAAPLLRYIADAGDNGQIDNNLQQWWRENRTMFPGGGFPPEYGDDDPCHGLSDPTEWCGQYYYANDLASLDQVFEAIASRLFTRIAR